jgi:hypothetical protein
VDPVPDPLLLRKSGSAGNIRQIKWISKKYDWSMWLDSTEDKGPLVAHVVVVLNFKIL